MHAHCLAQGQVWVFVHLIVILKFHAHGEWSLRLLHSLHLLSLHLSLLFLLFLLPYTFYFLDVVDNKPAHFRWGAGPLVKKNSSTVPTRTRLQLFFAQLLLWISSVITVQSQKCVKNMNPFMIERGNRCRRTIEFLIRAKRDQDKRAFEQWWSCSQRTSIAKIRRTNWKVITTRQIEHFLYGCRIPECCWNRTVFHDERHCRILTIHRFSGLSWVHFAKRWRNIWTERLDQRKHQNWARIGSCNLLLAR